MKLHAIPVVIALALVASGYSYYDYSLRVVKDQEYAAKEAAPASDWYVLRNISIRDFIEGDDPVLSFDSEVKKPHVSIWTIQAHKIDGGIEYPPICSTHGELARTPDDNKGTTVIKWSALMKLGANSNCQLPVGDFILKAHVKLEINGYPEKEVDRASGIFHVLEKGSLLHLSPEQAQEIQKLEQTE